MSAPDVIVGIVTTSGNVNQVIQNVQSNDVFGVINSAGQTIASATGMTPIGFGLNIGSTAVTFFKIEAGLINGNVSSGDVLDLTAGILGTIAAGAVIVGAAPEIGIVSGIAAGAAIVSTIMNNYDTLANAFNLPGQPSPDSPSVPFGSVIVDDLGNARIDPQCRNDFNNAQHPPRKDPLTFDLDGDGLETVATSAGILFDHDGDGVKQGTGWVGSDDGFLALDRNGNGTIDNGTELFGDATPLANGLKAADGFAALTQQDTNGDGKVTSADAQWEDLRVWRDLNQDGVSQANELFTLNQLGIAAINVAKTLNNQTLANGNQIADLGSFTRADGSTGTMGDVSTMGDVNLAEDTFYREFTDHIPIADGVDLLPEMQGSGMVRDLHEAASLSPALKDLLTQFSQATTRHEQRALLDQMLDAWADTSGFITSLQQRAEAKFVGYDVVVTYSQFGNLNEGNYAAEASYAGMNWFDVGRIWEQKLHVLEAFNGRYFVDLDSSGTSGGTSSGGGGGGAGGGGGGGSGAAADNTIRIDIRLSEEQVGFLNSSFTALKDSIYSSLVVQTRLAPLFDLIDVVINDNTIALDFTRLEQTFATNIAADPINGISDLVDLVLCSKNMLSSTGWDGYGLMEHYIRTVPVSTELQATYKDLGVLIDGQVDFPITGTADSNIIVAGGTSDVIQGNGGNDVIFGGVGNDTVDGGLGDDVLEGGAGNDSLTGGAGNDLYLFGKGDGQDTIASDFDNAATKLNVLQFKNGILPSEIVASRTGYDLVLSIAGTTDKVTISQFFYRDTTDSAYNPIQKVIFSDGTAWDVATLTAKVFAGTTAADYIVGTIQNDVIHGQEGNDALFGQDGNDVLDGGNGNDNMYAGSGSDTLDGGAGNDYLAGGLGDDTYLFGRGDGQDIINGDDESSATKVNVLQFKDGVLPSDIWVTRADSGLVLTIAGTTDKITLSSYFDGDNPGGPGNPVQQVKFADGTTWDLAIITAKAFAGTPNADTISGTNNGETISGQAGADTLYGLNGDDVLNGGADNDYLSGDGGNDTLDGGTGNDTLSGGAGNDTYLFGKGDGQDVINGDWDTGSTKLNVLHFKDGVLPSEIVATRSGTDAVLSIAGTTDKITLGGFFYSDTLGNPNNPIQQVVFADGTSWDVAAIAAKVFAGTDAVDNITGTVADDVISGQAGADNLYGRDGNDTLNGGAGNDAIQGENGNDKLYGGDGNDALWGGNGNDTLDGGAGNDTLNDDTGNEIYLFGKGDGQDTINSYYDVSATKLNVLQFKSGVLPSEVYAARSGTDLILSIAGTTDTVKVGYFFNDSNPGNPYNPLQQVRFDDGTIWDLATITAKAFAGTPNADSISGTNNGETISGQAGADTLYGLNGDDVLNGGADNDYLSGDGGNDTLDGGTGNDTLSGGAGNDTYLFGKGDGQDVINGDWDTGSTKLNVLHFKDGVLPSEIVATRSGTDAVLSIAGTTDKITLGGFFYSDTLGNPNNPIQQVVFADGTSWNVAAIAAKVFAGTDAVDNITGTVADDVINGQAGADNLYGRDGNDTLNGGAGNDFLNGENGNDLVRGGDGNDFVYGGNGNDTLDGGAGNDAMRGNAGNNIYSFGKGDGQDEISGDYDISLSKLNVLQFKGGVLSSEVVAARVNDDLMLSIIGTTDSVKVKCFFYENNTAHGFNGVQQIAFDDGTTWDIAAITTKAFSGTAAGETTSGTISADVMNGQGGADTMYGLNGDDVLNGGADNDYLTGDGGNDILEGGAGNDTLSGGAGNDIFRFVNADEGVDSISDFSSGVDKIQIAAGNFGMAAGDAIPLLSGATTPMATGTVPEFLYNTTTGALYFDRDGADTAYATVQILTLTGQKTLVASDIVAVDM